MSGGEHLQYVQTDVLNGHTRLVVQFSGGGVEAVFTPGESVATTLLKLEKLTSRILETVRERRTKGNKS